MKDRGYGFQYRVHVVSGYAFAVGVFVCVVLSNMSDERLIAMLWTTIVFASINIITERS